MAVTYSLGGYEFRTERFFPTQLFHELTDLRVTRPQIIREQAARRRRRPTLTTDGKLTILACDHPARMVTNVGDDPLFMGNRFEYLGRIARVITSPDFDGIMSTPDIIEDLFLLNHWVIEHGGQSFLDDKILMGCMNRGGLAGTAFEMDDRFTAYTAEGIAAMRLDAAKVMFRLDPQDPASGITIEACSRAVNECAARGIPIFVEALMVEKVEGKYKTKKNAADLIKVIGVASGLGTTSAYTWLKIPYCENYEAVARATTCPTLMLGGEAKGDPTGLITEFVSGMAVGGAIRGALVGRNILFPGKDDPYAVALAVYGIVHKGYTVDQALDCIMSNRDRHIDLLAHLMK